MEYLSGLLIAVLGGGNLLLFIRFLIERHDRKKEKEEHRDELKDEVLTIKKDGIRTQLLMLILLRHEETREILRVAEYYFKTLQGDWYMTSIFNKWLVDNNVAKPEWFKGGNPNE